MLELLAGPMIKTRYLGWTETRPARVVATHRRDSQTTYRAQVYWDDDLTAEANHQAAVQKLLDNYWFNMEDENKLIIAGRGHDADAYYWLAVASWRLEPQRACA